MALNDDVVSWSATANMRSGYTASMEVSNALSAYGQSLRSQPVNITLETVGDSEGTTGGQISCFTGNKTWVNGLIASIADTHNITARRIGLHITSYFARLARKPIGTESNLGAPNAALTTIANDYAGIPGALFSFSLAGGGEICGPVDGDSILEEMRQIAQAGLGTLFVGEDGILKAQPWKTISSGSSVTLPYESIISATVTRSDEPKPTRIKIKGCYITEYDKGNQEMTDGKSGTGPGGTDPDPGGGANPGGMGKPIKCIKNGVAQRHVDAKVGIAKGEKEDALNGPVFLGGLLVGSEMQILEGQGSALVRLQNSSGDGTLVIEEGDYEMSMGFSGRIRPRREWRDRDEYSQRPAAVWGGQLAGTLQDMPNILLLNATVTGGPAGGGGVKGGGANKGGARHGNEQTETQLNVTVDDVNLFGEFGMIVEEMENRYVSEPETLTKIAIQRFQEIKMERATWSVQVSYLTCLSLNTVVSFLTPPLADGNRHAIKGLLVAITTNWNSAPQAGQTLTILGFSDNDVTDMGTTSYSTGNLLVDPNLLNAGTAWTVDQTASISVGGGALVVRVVQTDGEDNFGAQVQQDNMTIGETYTISWTQADTQILYDPGLGASDDLEAFETGETPITYSAGSHTYDFVATGTSHSFRWNMNYTLDDDNSYWTITNIKIKKTIIG